MLTNKLSIVAAAALLTANLGLAGENTAVAPIKAAENHFYTSLEGGVSYIDYGKISHNRYDYYAAAGRLAVGYLMNVTDNFDAGIELGFGAFQKHHHVSKSKKTDFRASTRLDTDLLGVVKYNFTNNFNIFGKVGVVYVDDSYSLKFTNGSQGGSGNGFAPKAALGVGYKINQNFETTLSYSHVFGDGLQTSERSNSALLVGLIYNFV